MIRTLTFLIVFCYLYTAKAQVKDSLITPNKINAYILPTSLVVGGITLNALEKNKPLKFFKSVPSTIDYMHYSSAAL